MALTGTQVKGKIKMRDLMKEFNTDIPLFCGERYLRYFLSFNVEREASSGLLFLFELKA